MEAFNIIFYIIMGVAALIFHVASASIVKSLFSDYDWWRKEYNIVLLIPPVSLILFSVSALVIIGVFLFSAITDILD